MSPTLPHDGERFAALLGGVADRVVVDTFFGDGAKGRRTQRRPLPDRFAELGLGEWQDETTARALFERLRSLMGDDRVGWAQAGFNDLAVGSARSQVTTRRLSLGA